MKRDHSKLWGNRREVECSSLKEIQKTWEDGGIPVITEGVWTIDLPILLIVKEKTDIRAEGDVTVFAYDYANVTVTGQARVLAFDFVHVYSYDQSYVKAYDQSTVWAHDSSEVFLFDRSFVSARDRTNVTARDNSSVEVRSGKCFIEAFDKAYVDARGNGVVHFYDQSTGKVWGNDHVETCHRSSVRISNNVKAEALNNSHIRAFGTSKVRAYEFSKIEAYDEARVSAFGHSRVIATNRAVVEAYQSSNVEAYGESTVWAEELSKVRAFNLSCVRVNSTKTHIEAYHRAVVFRQTPHALIDAKGEEVVIVDSSLRTVLDWVYAQGGSVREDGRIVLYKWVDENGYAKNNVRYVEGQMVEAPDWDPNPEIECGNGLHACVSLREADNFTKHDKNERLAVELWVDPKDCRLPRPNDEYPNKIRFQKAYVARVWKEEND